VRRLRTAGAGVIVVLLAGCLQDPAGDQAQAWGRQSIRCDGRIPEFAIAPGRAVPTHHIPKVCACVWNSLDAGEQALSARVVQRAVEDVPAVKLQALGARLDGAVKACLGG